MMPATASASLHTRLGMMIVGWGTVGLCYTLGSLTPRTAQVLQETTLDRFIPFNASAIWLYLSFFLLVPAAYLFADAARLKPLMRAMQLSALLAMIVFVAYPTTLAYPVVSPATSGSTILDLLISFDSARNCLPSLHGALTVLCVIALWQRPWLNVFVLLWAFAIAWAVIQTRRHLAVDLGAGLLLGVFCAWLVARKNPENFSKAEKTVDTK
ncbi:MAG: phosphatase PAP2 family protein [Methylobacillus sp.]|jgi:hypothetical protein|nr:phosphatase PAP2 family protein [Methylobacillus sp.]